MASYAVEWCCNATGIYMIGFFINTEFLLMVISPSFFFITSPFSMGKDGEEFQILLKIIECFIDRMS